MNNWQSTQTASEAAESEMNLRMLAARFRLGQRITLSQYALIRLAFLAPEKYSYRWDYPDRETEVSMKHWGEYCK